MIRPDSNLERYRGACNVLAFPPLYQSSQLRMGGSWLAAPSELVRISWEEGETGR